MTAQTLPTVQTKRQLERLLRATGMSKRKAKTHLSKLSQPLQDAARKTLPITANTSIESKTS